MERQAGVGSSKQPVSDKQPHLIAALRKREILATDGCFPVGRGGFCKNLYHLSLHNLGEEKARQSITEVNDPATPEKVGAETQLIRIQVLESIGDGGFGSVYKCAKRERSASQDICLKLSLHWDFSPNPDKERNKHIIREVETFLLFKDDSHDNIIQFMFACYCSESERVFIGLEYFSGDDLSKLIKLLQDERKRFAWDDINTIMEGVVNAVIHVQKYDIVHCDIKPHNVMFNCQTKAVKLIDFGCAVEFKPDSVDFGGTSEYMAPEMLEGGRDVRVYLDSTDVYGIGALMYHILTFERPWHDKIEVRKALRAGRRHARKAIHEAICQHIPCAEGDGSSFNRTHLQHKLKEILHGEHYLKYPYHCDLVHEMLHFNAEKRIKCADIKKCIEVSCRDRDLLEQRRKAVKEEADRQRSQEEANLIAESPIIPQLGMLLGSSCSASRGTSTPNNVINRHQRMMRERLSAQGANSQSGKSHSGGAAAAEANPDLPHRDDRLRAQIGIRDLVANTQELDLSNRANGTVNTIYAPDESHSAAYHLENNVGSGARSEIQSGEGWTRLSQGFTRTVPSGDFTPIQAESGPQNQTFYPAYAASDEALSQAGSDILMESYVGYSCYEDDMSYRFIPDFRSSMSVSDSTHHSLTSNTSRMIVDSPSDADIHREPQAAEESDQGLD